MDEEQLFTTILHNTYTKTDYLRRLRILREFFEQKYYVKGDLSISKYLENHQINQTDQQVIKSWGNNFFSSFKQNNLSQLFNKFTGKIKAIPILTMYLAFIPQDNQVREISEWLRQELKTSLLIDFRINPSLTTGCAFVWKGKYHDFSLKYFLSKNKEIITSLINEYASRNNQKP